ncbi:MAG: ribosome small subunit-dependent GTPase A [Acidimicrobiales bacterium]
MADDDALRSLGWTPERAAAAPPVPEGGAVGRVERVDRGWCRVAGAFGSVHVRTLREGAVGAVGEVAVGDWVVLSGLGHDDGAPDVAVAAVLERTTALVRRATGRVTAPQVLAANIDVVLVVHGLHVEPHLGLVERELVVAHDAGAEPVVVLTKADVNVDAAAAGRALAAELLDVAVLVASATTGEGLDAVRAAVHDRTFVLLGPSGAGKSTLANALLGSAAQRIGAVREGDGQGRHTTSASQLIVVPGGGVCIDTPGIREVGLFGADDGLAAVFADVEALAETCRFDDCAHTVEPGCAVQGGVEPGRLARWRALRAELDEVDDALTAAERRPRRRRR